MTIKTDAIMITFSAEINASGSLSGALWVVERFERGVSVNDTRIVRCTIHEVVNKFGSNVLSTVWFSNVQADEVWEICFGVVDSAVFVVGVCHENSCVCVVRVERCRFDSDMIMWV